jgi:osmotically-inducible protein OsmY
MTQSLTMDRVEQTSRILEEITRQNRETPHDSDHGDSIAKAALRRFRCSHNLELRRLRCESYGGNLIICGQVSTYYLKQLAQETIRSLEGVVRIVNRLEVVYVQARVEENESQQENS